jgi:hypothetical protein
MDNLQQMSPSALYSSNLHKIHFAGLLGAGYEACRSDSGSVEGVSGMRRKCSGLTSKQRYLSFYLCRLYTGPNWVPQKAVKTAVNLICDVVSVSLCVYQPSPNLGPDISIGLSRPTSTKEDAVGSIRCSINILYKVSKWPWSHNSHNKSSADFESCSSI